MYVIGTHGKAYAYWPSGWSKSVTLGVRSDKKCQHYLLSCGIFTTLWHIAQVFDVGEDDKGYYLIMEYVVGPPITSNPDKCTPPPPVSLRDYIAEVRSIDDALATVSLNGLPLQR